MEQAAERIRFDFFPGLPIVVETQATLMSSDAGMIAALRQPWAWSRHAFSVCGFQLAMFCPQPRVQISPPKLSRTSPA